MKKRYWLKSVELLNILFQIEIIRLLETSGRSRMVVIMIRLRATSSK